MAGRDKCLLQLNDSTILDALIQSLSHQANKIVINSNRAPEYYRSFQLPVIPDMTREQLGPLSGVASVLAWLEGQGYKDGWLLTVPCDSPFLPSDLADRLLEEFQQQGKEIAYAHSGRPHFLTALWRLGIRDRLQRFIASGGRAVKDFFATCDAASVEFIGDDIDPFFNINTPEDYQLAKRTAEKQQP